MSSDDINTLRRNRWYFGGLASATAIGVTHPLDLIKVHLQTQQLPKKGIGTLVGELYKRQGILGFYNGISASLTRQLLYTTTRFGIYDAGKNYINADTFLSRMGLAILGGLVGGIMGVPPDMVNVRMQNDMKLPADQRRNYRHVFDGFLRVYREEGFAQLFSGGSMAVPRGVLMTVGQIVSYDQVKDVLLGTGVFEDNTSTHMISSVMAAGFATILTQPMDVLKTRVMNAKPGEFNSFFEVVKYTAKAGPTAFFKGFVPAFVRLGPHTVLLFLIMEQLRLHFGILPPDAQKQFDAKKQEKPKKAA